MTNTTPIESLFATLQHLFAGFFMVTMFAFALISLYMLAVAVKHILEDHQAERHGEDKVTQHPHLVTKAV